MWVSADSNDPGAKVRDILLHSNSVAKFINNNELIHPIMATW